MFVTNEMIINSAEVFVFLSIELTALFIIISYIVGIVQHTIPANKIENILGGKQKKAYIIAGLFAAITPFCSCSTIPFLKGLLKAKAGFGTIMVFLLASPLINPIIIGLFVVTFGWQVTLFYFIMAMTIAIISAYSLEKLGFEKYIKKQAYDDVKPISCCAAKQKVNKWQKIWQATWADFRNVAPFLFIGISLGAIIYGFMPSDYIAEFASDDNPFAIPFAAVIGIPLYIRAEAVIPLSAALAAKGMGLGAVMALIIGSAGASLTEVIILKSIFNNQLIVAFVTVVVAMAIISGTLYRFIF